MSRAFAAAAALFGVLREKNCRLPRNWIRAYHSFVRYRWPSQMIVDAHAAHRAGSAAGNSDFFNQRAMEHIMSGKPSCRAGEFASSWSAVRSLCSASLTPVRPTSCAAYKGSQLRCELSLLRVAQALRNLSSGGQAQVKSCAAPRAIDCPQAPTMRLND